MAARGGGEGLEELLRTTLEDGKIKEEARKKLVVKVAQLEDLLAKKDKFLMVSNRCKQQLTS